MIASYTLTPDAARDLEEIVDYVCKQAGEERALHVYRYLRSAFSLIGENPGIGHMRDDLADETLRIWSVFSYLVIYRPEPRTVQILHIVHGARNLPAVIENDG